jgi:hypothetical protein
MNKDKKRLKQDYKVSKRPMGVFLIRNTLNEKVFVVAGLDLQGIVNRHKFQLATGSHKTVELQKDWNNLGSDKFEFEIVDQMEPLDDPSFDPKREVEFMERMWLDKLQPFGERGYNEKKLTREQRLSRNSAKRRNEA